jgi:CBS domain-containing protein
MSATVKDVMTTRVVSVREHATFKDMAVRLREHRVSAFPVLDDGDKVIGIVSEADLLTKEAFNGEVPGFFGGILRHREQGKASGVTAADVMTKPAITIGPHETVAHAARVMYGRRVRRLPVVTPDGHLVGIVSRADLLSVYSRAEEAIMQEITDDVMRGDFMVDPGRFTVTIKDGIVTVEGKPENSTVGHDIIGAIRHVEGVVAVRDRLTYPPAERSASPGPAF